MMIAEEIRKGKCVIRIHDEQVEDPARCLSQAGRVMAQARRRERLRFDTK